MACNEVKCRFEVGNRLKLFSPRILLKTRSRCRMIAFECLDYSPNAPLEQAYLSYKFDCKPPPLPRNMVDEGCYYDKTKF